MRKAILVFLTSTLMWVPGFGQLATSASVPISLRIPGSITLSLQTVPVDVNIVGGNQRTFSVPLSVSWNLDPREVPAFRVVAYFQNSQSALVEPSSAAAVPASSLISRWGQGEFMPFSSDNTVTLFRTTILPAIRRGEKNDVLELRIADPAASSLPDGSYQGVLVLEVRHY